MKNKVIAALGAMAIAGVIGFSFSQSGIVNADPKLSSEEVRKQVSELYPGEITELELDKDGKKVVYEVEIELEGKQYELKIDGNSGEVLSLEEFISNDDKGPKEVALNKEKAESDQKLEFIEKETEEVEKDDDTPKSNTEVKKEETAKVNNEAKTPVKQNNEVKKETNKNSEPKNDVKKENKNTETKTATKAEPKNEVKKAEKAKEQPKNNSSKKTVISMAEAKRIALNNFSGTITDIELDDDDGRLIYEVEIENGNKEAEIELDAYTGKVILLDIETEDDDD